MRKDITVAALSRDTRGKNEARRLRVKGSMPAVLYGNGIDPLAVAVSPKELTVLTIGDPKGVKLQGGIHEIITREVEIECLPDDIPEVFNVNVAEMMIGQSLRASDIPMAGSMKLLSPGDAVISHVVSLRAEEAAPVDAAAAAPEPEVVKKGKKEEAAPAADAKKK
jgi:large subunit ribosomal protein L25